MQSHARCQSPSSLAADKALRKPGQPDAWLMAEPEDAMAVLLASDVPAMQTYRMSRAVNTPRNNTEQLLQSPSAERVPAGVSPSQPNGGLMYSLANLSARTASR